MIMEFYERYIAVDIPKFGRDSKAPEEIIFELNTK